MRTTTKDLSVHYHNQLPPECAELLIDLGVSEGVIHGRRIGWDGKRFTVPIVGENRTVVGFEYLRLDDTGIPRPMIESGNPLRLYGRELLDGRSRSILICQGVLESLVAASHGLTAVSATGSGLDFDVAWAPLFAFAAEVFVCFDRSRNATAASDRLLRLIPSALRIEWPEDAQAGTMVEFFADLGKSRNDFLRLLAEAGRDDQ